MRAEQGFTLIEILVVVLILGITLGFALLSFGDFGASRRAVVTAEQFSSYVKLVQQRAIVEANTLGLNINKEGYQAYRFTQKGWQLMPERSIFRKQHFPRSVTATLDSRLQNNSNSPDIIMTATGTMTEFKMDFGTHKNPRVIKLSGSTNGQLSLQAPQ